MNSISKNYQCIRVPEDFPSIEKACNNATEGSIIEIRSGNYRESLIISKDISLIGNKFEKVNLYPKYSDAPIITYENKSNLINFPNKEILIENINFFGDKSNQLNSGILSKKNLSIIKCTFNGFSNRNKEEDNYNCFFGGDYDPGIAISFSNMGNLSIIRDCEFLSSDIGISIYSVSDFAVISNKFIDIFNYSIRIGEHSNIASQNNLISKAGICMDNGSKFKSEYDVFNNVHELISSYSECEAHFSNANISGRFILSLGIGEDLVDPLLDEKWCWGKPKLIFSNCKIDMKGGNYPLLHYDFSAPYEMISNSQQIDLYEEGIITIIKEIDNNDEIPF